MFIKADFKTKYENAFCSKYHHFPSPFQRMCSEADLKDLGLPMGPRKKLVGLLTEESNKKVSHLPPPCPTA